MMTRARSAILLTAAALAASIAGYTPDARACAVLTPDQSIPVLGHKMILSLSKDKTTLWDQFLYTGDPASFAWILPTKGQVTIGVSSDALFNAIGQVTAPQIYAPGLGCPNSCMGMGGGDGGGANGGGSVEVIAEQVVGDYQTVQLSSTDPNALKDWLQMNGYPIPMAVAGLLDAYVNEGFDFVAIKLLPGKGLDSVQPVRITIPGAAPSIPIRLLAAGTGELTQVTVWVASDGKYLPGNAPIETILDADLTWDFATKTSDYDTIRTNKLAASKGLAYLVEQSHPYYDWELKEPLQSLIDTDPTNSGYGKDAAEAKKNLDADLAAFFGTLGTQPWITRLSADLSRTALQQDLALEAAADQSTLYGDYTPAKHVNAGECPPDPCAMGGGGAGGGNGGGGAGGNGMGGAAGTGGNGTGNNGNGANPGDGGTTGCGCGVPGSSPAEGAALGLVLALGLALRRARRAAR